MEFREKIRYRRIVPKLVDIGTEWNLEDDRGGMGGINRLVDIGTEWNLEAIASAFVGSLRG